MTGKRQGAIETTYPWFMGGILIAAETVFIHPGSREKTWEICDSEYE